MNIRLWKPSSKTKKNSNLFKFENLKVNMLESEKVNVVDENDNIIREIYRKDAKNEDILRVVCVFIINSKDEILLQLRSSNSQRYPSHWDSAAGGHVDSHEDYDEGARREMQEEIGIDTKLEFLGKDYFELDDGRKHFNATYIGHSDKKFKIDHNELEAVKFFSKKEFISEFIGDNKRTFILFKY